MQEMKSAMSVFKQYGFSNVEDVVRSARNAAGSKEYRKFCY